MLTNGFTRDEIAACTLGTAVKCIESVVMHLSTKVTFTAGLSYKVESLSDPFMVIKNDDGRNHMLDGLFFRKHFALDKAPQVVHLSETGVNAGRRLCGAARDDGNRSVHAMYAPLDNPTFRESVCGACMGVWAIEAYDEGEEKPEYIAEARRKHNAALAGASGHAAHAPQLALEMQ